MALICPATPVATGEPAQPAKAKSQSDREHEEDEPHLRQGLDVGGVPHQGKDRGGGPDQDAGGKEAHDDRKADSLAHPPHHSGHKEDDGKVLNEENPVHRPWSDTRTF